MSDKIRGEIEPASARPREPGGRTRRILLVDCDMFFVQVARLEDPDGAGTASLLIVGGSSTGRGVVTSASYEVRRFGVHSGMPTGAALRLCPDAVVVGVPRGACVRRSREVRAVLEELAPVVQAASIDEFYLDLTGTERLLAGETLTDTARRVRQQVLERTGIGVSVGGGTNRLLAKLAARRAKPAGEFIIAPGSEADFLNDLPLAEIPGVGPALLATLRARGVARVSDLLPIPTPVLTSWVGANRAGWLQRRAAGLDESPVLSREPRKSVSAERTFRRDIDDNDRLESLLLGLCVRVGAALRAEGLRARTITVKLRDSDFSTRSGSRSVERPVESDHALFDIARPLLASLRTRRRMGARLLGVGAGGLTRGGDTPQLALFSDEPQGGGSDPGETARDRALSRAVDGLKERFGDRAVLPARIVPPDPDTR